MTADMATTRPTAVALAPGKSLHDLGRVGEAPLSDGCKGEHDAEHGAEKPDIGALLPTVASDGGGG